MSPKKMKIKNKPNICFIGVGAPRAGTTWVSQCLKEHPEIFIPYTKELRFFGKRPELGNKSLYEIEGLEGYYKRFKGSKNLKAGEFTPAYMFSKEIIKILKKYFPQIKIIFCLRDPVERYVSHYNFNRGNRMLKKDENSPEEIIEQGYYHKYLKNWFAKFDKKQIKVILFEDIKNKPEKTLREMYEYLGVDANFIPPSTKKKINQSGTNKHPAIVKTKLFLGKISSFLKGKKLFFVVDFMRFVKFDRLLVFLWHNNIKPEKKYSISKKEKENLKKLYGKDIQKLEKLIKKDLSKWKEE